MFPVLLFPAALLAQGGDFYESFDDYLFWRRQTAVDSVRFYIIPQTDSVVIEMTDVEAIAKDLRVEFPNYNDPDFVQMLQKESLALGDSAPKIWVLVRNINSSKWDLTHLADSRQAAAVNKRLPSETPIIVKMLDITLRSAIAIPSQLISASIDENAKDREAALELILDMLSESKEIVRIFSNQMANPKDTFMTYVVSTSLTIPIVVGMESMLLETGRWPIVAAAFGFVGFSLSSLYTNSGRLLVDSRFGRRYLDWSSRYPRFLSKPFSKFVIKGSFVTLGTTAGLFCGMAAKMLIP